MILDTGNNRIVRAVLRHNGIPDCEHQAIIDERIFTVWKDGRRRHSNATMRVYRQIYGSLTEAERARAERRAP